MLAVSIVPLSVLIFSPRPADNGSISARMPWLTSRPPPFRPLRLLRIGGRLPRTAQTAEHTARSSASTRGQRTHRRAQWRAAQLYRVRIPSLLVAYLLTPGREDGNDERTSSPTTPPTLSCAPPTGATRTHPKNGRCGGRADSDCREGAYHPLHQGGEIASVIPHRSRCVLCGDDVRHVATEDVSLQRRHPLRRKKVLPEPFDENPAGLVLLANCVAAAPAQKAGAHTSCPRLLRSIGR